MPLEAKFHAEAEWNNHLLRIPADILPDLESKLRVQINFVVAWLQTVCKSFPGCSLLEIVQRDPGLFPSFIHMKERADSIQDYLVMTNEDVLLREVRQPEHKLREESREAELEAFRACRFRQGFASAGMLCNEPPIPLRVLDFLEAQDLVRLSLVCKATHQASHILYMREETVADRIQSSHPLGTRPHLRMRARARILRGIRIASLFHGTPEAIPFWEGKPLFLPSNIEHNPLYGSLDWVSISGDMQSPISHVTWAIGNERARAFRLLDRLDIIFILEKPQLEALLIRIAPWLMMDAAETSTMLDIELLLRAAIQNEQPVLFFKWWKRRGKRKRVE